MKAVWVTRSFLDYRIPVYEALSSRLDGQFSLFYNADYVPDRCCAKVQRALGSRAIGLRGERALRFGSQAGFANMGVRVPYQRGLIKAVLSEKPDVLISDGFMQWTYAPLWLRATRRIPHVMCYERTVHTERRVQRWRRAYRRFVMRWIDAMCCSGQLCGEYVQSLGFPSNRITYGHMTADVEGIEKKAGELPSDVATRLRSELGLNGLVFLYVGQLIPRKGVMELLTAWEVFTRRIGPNTCSLLLVGDGVQRDDLHGFCRSHCLSSVHFTGQVDYDHLVPYYKAANAFIIPTLEDNWSLVVPEAMACDLPILCSKYNGCWPELVKAENGWVFDPLDVCDTLRVLERCFIVNSALPDMGRASRTIVINHSARQAVDALVAACNLAVQRSVTH